MKKWNKLTLWIVYICIKIYFVFHMYICILVELCIFSNYTIHTDWCWIWKKKKIWRCFVCFKLYMYFRFLKTLLFLMEIIFTITTLLIIILFKSFANSVSSNVIYMYAHVYLNIQHCNYFNPTTTVQCILWYEMSTYIYVTIQSIYNNYKIVLIHMLHTFKVNICSQK